MSRSTDVSVRLGRALALPLLASLVLAAAVAGRAGVQAPGEEAPLLMPRVQDGPYDGNVAIAVEPPPRPGSPERPLRAAVGGRLSAAPLLLAANGAMAQHGLQLSVVREEEAAARLQLLRRGEVDVALVPLPTWAAQPLGEPFLLAGWSRGMEGVQGQAQGRVAVVGAEGAWLWRALRAARPGLRGQVEVLQVPGADEAARLLASGAVQGTVGPLPAWPGARPLSSSADLPGGMAEVWVAAPGLRAQAPGALAALCAGTWDGLSVLAEDPAGAHRQLAAWAGRPVEDIRGELARWHLGGFSDNALFFGLTGGPSTFEALLGAQSAAGLGAAPRVALPGAVVASLSGSYRGLPWARTWAVRERVQLAQRSLVGQPVLLHFAEGTRGLLPGDGLLLDALGETLKQFPAAVLGVQGLEPARTAWLQGALRGAYGITPDRLVPWEDALPTPPPAEAPSACAVQLQTR